MEGGVVGLTVFFGLAVLGLLLIIGGFFTLLTGDIAGTVMMVAGFGCAWLMMKILG
jgi:hypothetical protein